MVSGAMLQCGGEAKPGQANRRLVDLGRLNWPLGTRDS